MTANPTPSTPSAGAEQRLRQTIVEHGLRFAPSGLSQGTSGNLSIRLRENADGSDPGDMLITPSGVDYQALQPQDLPRMRLHDAHWSGPLKPSSEWRFHRDIYLARPEVGAIVHAHPTYCTALATQRKGIPAFHYMVAIAGGRDIRCAPYATFGTEELSKNAVAALQGRRACLLSNHGLIVVGKKLPSTFAMAVEIEELAHQYLLTLMSGAPVVLPDDEMDKVLALFAQGYGENAQKDMKKTP